MFPYVTLMKKLRIHNVSIHRNFDHNHLKNKCARKNLDNNAFVIMTFKVMLNFMEILCLFIKDTYSFDTIKVNF